RRRPARPVGPHRTGRPQQHPVRHLAAGRPPGQAHRTPGRPAVSVPARRRPGTDRDREGGSATRTTGLTRPKDRSRAAPADGSAAEPGPAGLLRPHGGSFTAVVTLQIIGAVAGLVPLLAVVELGRTLLTPGPIDHGRVRLIVIVGAAGLLAR